MLTKQRTKNIMQTESRNLPEVEYPKEVIERWDKEVEIARAQLATGELVPKTAAEMAAEWGIKIG
ncbi:MAG: hypothetical protein LBC70_11155 [Chitinispirillales bacterium]|jgi:hypothetical protein|nr:hypothetical protein [Chitinispirillales bacterium]